MKRAYLILLLSMLGLSIIKSQQPAFPGAEGSGRFASGGRGGSVYEVTNLSNSGPGSIVEAVSSGNRTIVFRVSGTISLGSVILSPKSNTTIAGQTAPGDGICIKGRIKIDASNIIIRYIRVRVDAGAANSNGDAIDISSGSNIIIDHVTASYARDEGISCQEETDDVTVQWCIISEGLTFEGHSYGSLVRGDYGDQKSYHHNLYAHNNGRNPRPGNYTDIGTDPEGLHFDFRNNVVYNWAGARAGYNADDTEVSRYNFVGNAYIRGPESGSLIYREAGINCYGFFKDNSLNGITPEDPWTNVDLNMSAEQRDAYKSRSAEIPMEPVTTTSPEQAKRDVLASAGASIPKRDTIDRRIVKDVLDQTGHSIDSVINQPEGGWPPLMSLPAPTDTDKDGMPNDWEIVHGLDTNNAADRNIIAADGYTMLEKYLNGIEFSRKVEGIEFSITSDSLIRIIWADMFLGEEGYIIERAIPGQAFSLLDTVIANTSTYTDSTADAISEYEYRIIAFNDLNESPYSDTILYTPVYYTIITSVVGQGSVSVTPDVTTYLSGTVANVTAAADPGWEFSHWSGDLSGSEIQSSITFDSDKTITANFYEIVSVTDLNSQAMYRIYPNPVNDILNIELSNNILQKAFIQLFDCTGRIVHTENMHGTKYMLDLNDLASGIYWISILIENEDALIEKIIKQ